MITYDPNPSITVNYPDGTSAHTGGSSGSGTPSGSTGGFDDFQRERTYFCESSNQKSR